MKKTLLFCTAACFLLSESNAELSVNEYTKHARFFPENVNLINGSVLRNSDFAKMHRFFGPVKFHEVDKKHSMTQTPTTAATACCSRLDSSQDPTTALLILLFPSPGGNLSESTVMCVNSCFKPYQVEFVAGMLDIANKSRNGTLTPELCKKIQEYGDAAAGAKKNEAAKTLVQEAFPFVRGGLPITSEGTNFHSKFNKIFAKMGGGVRTNKIDNRLVSQCADLICYITKSVDLEGKLTDANNKKPYPELYTNFIICTYAWCALDDDQIGALSNLLNQNKVSFPKSEDLVKKLANSNTEFSTIKYFPFALEEQILEQAQITYANKNFADCAETSLRHFFSMMLCKLEENTLIIDTDRIPSTATKLRDFFVIYKNVTELSHKGDVNIREAWCNVVSGLENVRYRHTAEKCELEAGWKNFVKALAALMKDYKGDTEAERTIAMVLKEDTSITADNLITILNGLLKIRKDIKLKAEQVPDKKLKMHDTGEIVGTVIFTDEKNILAVDMEANVGHNCFGKLSVRNNKSIEIPEAETLWIVLVEAIKTLCAAAHNIPVNNRDQTYKDALYKWRIFFQRYPLMKYFLLCKGVASGMISNSPVWLKVMLDTIFAIDDNFLQSALLSAATRIFPDFVSQSYKLKCEELYGDIIRPRGKYDEYIELLEDIFVAEEGEVKGNVFVASKGDLSISVIPNDCADKVNYFQQKGNDIINGADKAINFIKEYGDYDGQDKNIKDLEKAKASLENILNIINKLTLLMANQQNITTTEINKEDSAF
jgi:hypothetical protein